MIISILIKSWYWWVFNSIVFALMVSIIQNYFVKSEVKDSYVTWPLPEGGMSLAVGQIPWCFWKRFYSTRSAHPKTILHTMPKRSDLSYLLLGERLCDHLKKAEQTKKETEDQLALLLRKLAETGLALVNWSWIWILHILFEAFHTIAQ